MPRKSNKTKTKEEVLEPKEQNVEPEVLEPEKPTEKSEETTVEPEVVEPEKPTEESEETTVEPEVVEPEVVEPEVVEPEVVEPKEPVIKPKIKLNIEELVKESKLEKEPLVPRVINTNNYQTINKRGATMGMRLR